MRACTLRCHGACRHARGCSTATEPPSGVPRHDPIPASRQWARRGRGLEARALRVSAEIPTSRAEGPGPSPLPRRKRQAAATARCPQDVSHSRPCSRVPYRGQALMPLGRSHRRRSSQPRPQPRVGPHAERRPCAEVSSLTLRCRTGGGRVGSPDTVACQLRRGNPVQGPEDQMPLILVTIAWGR